MWAWMPMDKREEKIIEANDLISGSFTAL